MRLPLTTLGLAALLLAAPSAFAGTCPKDKTLTVARDIPLRDSVSVKRQTLAIVDITGWRGTSDLRLRTRKLTVGKGGIVPTHEHHDRPSIVYVLSGEIYEHSAFCSVPILHKTGEWTPEFGPGHAHWWENKSGKTVVLLSSDVVPPEGLDKPEDM
ncbi:hypothetical protein VZ95_13510 [Elstera litoralis]|uniref:Cupin n=1 Tax=Elstera litoralis TaxID=552518 RepID=A0A0F3IU47_9PROT|nr:hypothetical protein [Elstera litoralis]KJV09114.1 hypothetical protein VZ95_13510 [Elstera litoralis]